jgi:NAD(P)-dependent dehydrogenase (short-subunit alcohol dehydrogenase family)
MGVRGRIKHSLRKLYTRLDAGSTHPEQAARGTDPSRSPAPPPVIHESQFLKSRNILITGAGPNIGRSIALEVAGQGANVFFTEIDAERRASLEAELAAYPVQSRGFLSDVTNKDDTSSLLAGLEDEDITIDLLVHNAKLQLPGGATETQDPDDWQRVFQTNVFGPVEMSRQVAARMIHNQIPGSIIFITSVHQWLVGRWPSYSASKAALNMVIKEMAADLAPHGIRVNGIAPGAVKTDPAGKPKPFPHALLHETTILPEYIGRAAVYLGSDYFSRYTTGTVLTVDNGLSLYSHRVDMDPPRIQPQPDQSP